MRFFDLFEAMTLTDVSRPGEKWGMGGGELALGERGGNPPVFVVGLHQGSKRSFSRSLVELF